VKFKIVALSVVVLFLCAGCSPSSMWYYFQKKEPVRSTPEALYARGTKEYQHGYYKNAREFYTRLKEEHPLHEYAALAELGIADSFYSDKEYLDAENAYRDFVTLYPNNENIPYALYQIGMCHYLQIGAIDRDQTETIKARREFERLIARYPQSKLAPLAEKLVRECKQKMAENEFYVAEFYFKQKKYAAALKRFETIARDYAGVGLDLKVEAYIAETKVRMAKEEKSKNAAHSKPQAD